MSIETNSSPGALVATPARAHLGRRRFIGTVVATAWTASAGPTLAQAPLGTAAPVRILVGYAPGTSPDTYARLIARKLQESWPAGVVVENKPGAGGTLAVAAALAAPPDGTTLLWGTNGEMAIAPAINRKLSVDPSRMKPVIELINGEITFVTTPTGPAKTVTEFISWSADKKPLLLGTFGPGSPHHLLALMFATEAKRPVEIVHYKGAQEYASDLRSGRIHGGFTSIVQARTWQQSGSARIIGVASLEPSLLMPELQTFRQAGLERAVIPLSHGIFAPPGTPDTIVAQVFAAFDKAMRTNEIGTYFKEAGNRVFHDPAGTFEVNVRKARALFAQIVETHKLTAE